MRLPRVFALLTLYVATPTLGADQVPLADHTGLADERNNGETVPLPSDNGTIRKVQTCARPSNLFSSGDTITKTVFKL